MIEWREFWDWFDALPAGPFWGWLAVVAVAFAMAAHFATWRRLPGGFDDE